MQFPRQIFRAYDIRGEYPNQINVELAKLIGVAYAQLITEQGKSSVFVGRDCRLSSPEITKALVTCLLASGIDVINLGEVASPLAYFAVANSATTDCLLMVTASHNPAHFNGIKMLIDGIPMSAQQIQLLADRAQALLDVPLQPNNCKGSETNLDILPAYIDRIVNDWQGDVNALGMVHIDAGNSVSGVAICKLLDALNIKYTPHYCEPDGRFPNHHPDPSNPANMQDLRQFVSRDPDNGALGIAFDGDGDRIGVVDENSNIIRADRLLMYLAAPLLVNGCGNPTNNTIVFDVKCSSLLADFIERTGGVSYMGKTGHSHMKKAVIDQNAVLGGEYSGHVFYVDRWFGFDDAIYTTIRLLEIISRSKSLLTNFFKPFKTLFSTDELNIKLPANHNKWDVVNLVIQTVTANLGQQFDGEIITIDGIRIQNKTGWGLLRCSNTSDVLVARFEADSKQHLADFHRVIQQALIEIDPGLNFSLGNIYN